MSARRRLPALAMVLACGGWSLSGEEDAPAAAGAAEDVTGEDAAGEDATIVAMCGADSTGLAPLDPAASRAVVDASSLATLSERTLDVVALQTAKLAADYGISADEIRVTLRWDDQFNVIYGVRVSIATDDHTLESEDQDPDGPLVNRCTECGELELCTATIEGVVEALARYEESSPPPPAPASPGGASTQTVSRRFGRLGIAGLSVLSVGAATTIAGGLLLVPGDLGVVRVFGPSYTNYRPASISLMAVGSAAMVTGAVLLSIGTVRGRRSSRWSLAPIPTPFGIGFTGAVRI